MCPCNQDGVFQMHVTRIELSDRFVDPIERGDCARVWFHSDNTVTQIDAHAQRAAPRPELIRDAIRQLKRMPEIRSGAEQLSFSPTCTMH